MKPLLTILLPLSLTSGAFSSEGEAKNTPVPGKTETATRCLICHGNAQKGQQRLAPPMAMVKRHYQSLNKQEFEQAVLAWVKSPDPKKSRMPGAIRRFKLMPAFPIPDEEMKKIARYIYQTDFTFPGNCNPSQDRESTDKSLKKKLPQKKSIK